MPQTDEVTEPETPEIDEATPAEETPVEETDPKLGPPGEKALDAFKERARKSEAEAKALAAKVKEFEDRDKSEQERLAERAEEAEKRVQEAEAKAAETELRLTRRDAAQKHKLPIDLADRIQGSTEEEIEADAERLATHLKPTDATDFDGGSRKTAKAPDRDELVRLAKEDPAEFNRRVDAGEISADALV